MWPAQTRFRARLPMDASTGPAMPFLVVIDRDYSDAWYGQQITAMAIK